MLLEIMKQLRAIRRERREAVWITVGAEGHDDLEEMIQAINASLIAGHYIVSGFRHLPRLGYLEHRVEAGKVLGVPLFYDPGVTDRLRIVSH